MNYIKLLEPKYFMPIAGRYTYSGKLAKYNDKRGEPELEEGFDFLVSKIDQNKSKGINCPIISPHNPQMACFHLFGLFSLLLLFGESFLLFVVTLISLTKKC